jgi:hypothetical protein
MSSHLSICATALFLAGTAPAFSQEPASRWDHNGSEVGLYASGNERIFRYTAPRVGLAEVGVTPGTVLFVGQRSVDTYSGHAYVFSRRCGPQAYFVSGSVSADQRTVTLFGDVPTRYDDWCRAIATRPDTLVFTFIEAPAPPPGIATAPPPPPTLSTSPAPPPVAAAPPASAPAPSSYPSTGTVGDTVGSERTAERVMN